MSGPPNVSEKLDPLAATLDFIKIDKHMNMYTWFRGVPSETYQHKGVLVH